jgi:hypothetical protein
MPTLTELKRAFPRWEHWDWASQAVAEGRLLPPEFSDFSLVWGALRSLEARSQTLEWGVAVAKFALLAGHWRTTRSAPGAESRTVSGEELAALLSRAHASLWDPLGIPDFMPDLPVFITKASRYAGSRGRRGPLAEWMLPLSACLHVFGEAVPALGRGVGSPRDALTAHVLCANPDLTGEHHLLGFRGETQAHRSGWAQPVRMTLAYGSTSEVTLGFELEPARPPPSDPEQEPLWVTPSSRWAPLNLGERYMLHWLLWGDHELERGRPRGSAPEPEGDDLVQDGEREWDPPDWGIDLEL